MFAFDLAPAGQPGAIVELPGVKAGMSFHLASQDRTGLSGNVALVYCEDGGKPDDAHTFTLTGTVPNVHGPVTANIAGSTLAGATEGSVTFANSAAFVVKVSVTTP